MFANKNKKIEHELIKYINIQFIRRVIKSIIF